MTTAEPISDLDWIAVDWGTSSLRAWAIGPDGAVLARGASADGMGALTPGGYEPALLRIVGPWLRAQTAPVPVVVCGMAGARQGWREAPYRSVPCAPVSGDGLLSVDTEDRRLSVRIVPGLSQASPADVMRGEETQLAGLAATLGGGDATVCMPGTHSKWARIEAGVVASFRTFMTGELFAIAAAHSVLRHSVAEAGQDQPAFLEAVGEMLEHPELLTGALFSVRARSLLSDAGKEAGRARLSGLLIGAELGATCSLWQGSRVHLVGAPALVEAYALALRHAGGETVVEDGEALTLAGLKAARAASLEVTS
jgi:2-dehydro-3-deoxygalactonokinase